MVLDWTWSYLEDEPVENIEHLSLLEYLCTEFDADDELGKCYGTATRTHSRLRTASDYVALGVGRVISERSLSHSIRHNGLTSHFVRVAETVYGKMATTIEIHPLSITTIFWTQVSLRCKKADDFSGYSLENFIYSKRNHVLNDS